MNSYFVPISTSSTEWCTYCLYMLIWQGRSFTLGRLSLIVCGMRILLMPLWSMSGNLRQAGDGEPPAIIRLTTIWKDSVASLWHDASCFLAKFSSAQCFRLLGHMILVQPFIDHMQAPKLPQSITVNPQVFATYYSSLDTLKLRQATRARKIQTMKSPHPTWRRCAPASKSILMETLS